MKKYLEKLPEEIRDLIEAVRRTACSENVPVYLVGGFVRDLILGVKNLDLDIVVEGDGINFAEHLAMALKARVMRHRRFGTAVVTVKPHLKIDLASARSEFYPQPAGLPVVAAGKIKEDLFRRDFTINAMAIRIYPGEPGPVVDIFGGRRDLRQKKVRILHGLSFIDDPTRILRAIRFEQRFNFCIEPKTLRLLKEAVGLGMLERVQPQRTRDELILDLKEPHPIKNIRRMQALSGFGFVSKGLRPSKNTYSLLRSIEREINWFNRAHKSRRKLDAWLMYFMGLIDFLAPKEAQGLCRKFALRRGEEKRILSFKKINKKIISELSNLRARPAKIFSILEPQSYEAILLIKAKYARPVLKKHIEDFFEIYNGMRVCIGGKDISNLGLAPGPAYKKIFTRVLNAKLNGCIKTREEELRLMKRLIRNGVD